jgi:hypothetical protein
MNVEKVKNVRMTYMNVQGILPTYNSVHSLYKAHYHICIPIFLLTKY